MGACFLLPGRRQCVGSHGRRAHGVYLSPFTLRIMRYILLALLALAALGGSAPLRAQTTQAPGSQTMLSPGDSVRIAVWRKPEMSGDFVIAPNGTITHPLFRDIKVAGMPLAAAEANVRQYLSQFEQNPQFV